MAEEWRRQYARWLVEAAENLKVVGLLTGEEPSPSLFHSQQAAEEATKAYLVFHNVPFRKTHDLAELGLQRVAIDVGLSTVMKNAANCHSVPLSRCSL